jgi:UDP-glucose 4-epimerase
MTYTTLVTGGAGFMGSHVADELISRDHRVVVLDDLSGGFVENVPSAADFVQGSVTDHTLINNLFHKYGFDYVFHLAAYAAEGLSHFIKRFNYTNNLIGSINLINAAVNHDVQAFVFTSSIAVYGAAQVPMTEDMVPEPEDSYGIAKYAVELDLKASRELFGLNYIVFRPHNVYGERQNIGDKYRNVLGIFINQMMQDQSLTVFGDGNQTRAFSYIGDVAPVIAVSVDIPEAYNQVFNVGAHTPYSVNYLAATVARVMGREYEVRHLDPRIEVKHAFSSHEKAGRIFGVAPEMDLEEGVRRMVEWAQTFGARQSKEFECIEIQRNMPPSWRKGQNTC